MLSYPRAIVVSLGLLLGALIVKAQYPLQTPTPKKSLQSDGRKLTAEEVATLREQRRYDVDLIASVNRIFAASAFIDRAKEYCAFSVAQVERKTSLIGLSGEETEKVYQELLNSRPQTQQAELERQQRLGLLREFLLTHQTNLQQCEGMLINGSMKMPADQELRTSAATARQQMDQVDRALASGLAIPDKTPPPAPADITQIYTVGGDVSSPELLFKPQPEFSQEARQAKVSYAKVRLALIVNADGMAEDVRVTGVQIICKAPGCSTTWREGDGPLGDKAMGLDRKAIEAVMTWRFKPAMRNGVRVRVRGSIETEFRTL